MVLFSQMKSRDVRPNCYTFPYVIKSCKKILGVEEGREVDCIVVKSGFRSNPFIGVGLIDMYSSFGEMVDAYIMFEEMPVRNVVAWTTMINGYISCGNVESARALFEVAPDRDIVLWNTMVCGYIGRGDMVTARKLFDEMPNRDVMAWNTVMDGYIVNGDVEAGERVFEEIPEKNAFSWHGLIGGYARKGRFFDVLNAFKRMLSESDVVPIDATLVTVLSGCSRLGAFALGKWVHAYADNNGYKQNLFVGNGLIDMYSKCGSIENAIEVFNSMGSRDLITWNTLIGGLAMHGRGSEALSYFDQMRNGSEKPDGVTFIGVLCACTHMGLVQKGSAYFIMMVEEYSIIPQIEHYGCMVDLLARAGWLKEAVDFITRMPVEADSVIWSALLCACRTYRNVELAELALEKLIELEPKNPANYVMLSNIYKDNRRLEDVARLKIAMRETGVRKPQGCSLIELNNDVTEFYSLDERHPQSKEIYDVLNRLRELESQCYESDHELLEEGT